MPTLLIGALLVAIGGIVGFFVASAVKFGEPVIRTIFRLDPDRDWPSGVQEEDPPPAWRTRSEPANRDQTPER
jgi:hypothetical protein